MTFPLEVKKVNETLKALGTPALFAVAFFVIVLSFDWWER